MTNANALVIPALLAADADVFLDKKQTQPCLKGFCVEPAADGGAFIVSSDGFRIGIFKVPAPEIRHGQTLHSAIVPANMTGCIVSLNSEMIKACKARVRNRRMVSYLVVMPNGDARVVEASDASEALELDSITASQSMSLIEVAYPDWRRMIPILSLAKNVTTDSGAHFTCANGAFIGDFAKLSPASGNKCVEIHTLPDNEDGPLFVRVADRDDFFGILMPMRVHYGNHELPFSLERANTSESAAA